MKSLLQSLIVLMTSTLVSGCMAMMPMGCMDMGKKSDMGNMQMGKDNREKMDGGKDMNSPVTGTKIEKRVGDMTLAFATIPSKPTTGENVLRVKLTDASGETIRDAVVIFGVTMSMPDMSVMEEKATLTKDYYQANAHFGMPGQWHITVKIRRAGEAELQERFTVSVT